MELKQYLLDKNLTIAYVAEQLGIHRNHLSSIVNRRHPPGPMLAKEIVRFTNGDVLLEDLLIEKKFCPCCGRKLPKNHQVKKT